MKFLFTRENATGLVRTVATFAYAWIATQFPFISDWLATVNIDAAAFTLLAGGLLYQVVRVAAEKWPIIGYVLIINQKPEYPEE